jgi:branched-chain amino acid transport system substrate-binding protein
VKTVAQDFFVLRELRKLPYIFRRRPEMKRSHGLPLIVLAVISILFATQCRPAPPTATEEVLKIGVLGPFSGPAAAIGEEFKISTEMAMESIDYRVGNYQIELVWIDSQSDPEKAVEAYEAAVTQDGIQAGILNWHSSVAVAVMEVTARHQIPHFFGFGATGLVNDKFESDLEKYGYWTTKAWPMPIKLSVNYVTALEDAIAAGAWNPPEKRLAIYGEDTDWGRSFGTGIRRQLETAGWHTVAEEFFPLEQTDFHSLMARLQDLEVTLLAGTSTAPESLSAFIRQADEAGLKAMIIADGLGWMGEWYELTGTASNFVIDQIPGWTTDGAEVFIAAFEDRSGRVPSPSSGGLAYDGAHFFIKILQTAYDDHGKLNNETIYQTIREKVWSGELTFTTADGAIIMSTYDFYQPPDPIVGRRYYTFPVLQYLDGHGYVIWPDEWQERMIQAKQDRN